jgi:hypothetical protein
MLGGAYLSTPEQIHPLLALLRPISPPKPLILPANEHEKRHNSPNLAFIKIKLSELVELNFLVKISLF